MRNKELVYDLLEKGVPYREFKNYLELKEEDRESVPKFVKAATLVTRYLSFVFLVVGVVLIFW